MLRKLAAEDDMRHKNGTEFQANLTLHPFLWGGEFSGYCVLADEV